MSEWISVKERLPKEREDVLAYDGWDMGVAWVRDGEWCAIIDDRDSNLALNLGGISHWMPLPEPPEDEE